MAYSQEGSEVTRLKSVNLAHFNFHGNFPRMFQIEHLGRSSHSLLRYREQTECVSLHLTCILMISQTFPLVLTEVEPKD